MLVFSEKEILGKSPVGTIIAQNDTGDKSIAAMMIDITQHPELYQQNEYENIRKNGEKVWVSWSNKSLLDAQDNFIGIIAIGTDITERRKAELALQKLNEELEIRVVDSTTELQQTVTRLQQEIGEREKAEARLRQLFEKSADAILIFDGGVFTDCNQAAVEMMRCANKEQLLSLHPSLISPLTQPDGRASLEKAKEIVREGESYCIGTIGGNNFSILNQ